LGHIVSKEGISVDPSKSQAVKDKPVLKSATEIKSFIRLAGYYRRFVQDFSKIVALLTKLVGREKSICELRRVHRHLRSWRTNWSQLWTWRHTQGYELWLSTMAHLGKT